MSTSSTQQIKLEPNVNINAVITQPHNPSHSQEKPTIVFLHFWGGSARTWSLVTPYISSTYQTVALDFRGWGESTGPSSATAYSITALASDVEASIRALELTKIILVGLSMGAKVAQLIASRSCSGFELLGLVLVSPAPATPLRLPPDMREQQLHAYATRDSAAFVAKKVLTATFQDTELPAFVVDDMIKGNKWARESWPGYAMREDVSENLGKIAVPVLVLAAEKDVIEPIDRVKKEVSERIAGAQLRILPGSGHLSPLDAAEAVAEHIVQFLHEV
ncbi:alpha/beta-hydrolase [Lophiostoma macrostomum CBS 122681]|uniref:Alpha/beta-hydrolase n=1 Tax=Lophiostoma macrostomum CBS 122681 TaxID=1314788 RepID=A0A6A6TQ05_9PLEO|nr:alpha/beta-hydrolase [Lophiostoma macrostomum CBS 122681]